MRGKTVLVVEDDADIAELIRYNLEREGYGVHLVSSAEDAQRKLREGLPDAMVLDLMLPGTDGLTFCRELRADARTRHLPLLMLTAKGEEADIVSGLEVGADDYIPKPFSPRVLVARMRAVLRRRTEVPDDRKVLKRGEIEIDPVRHVVRVQGKQVDLTFTEFRVLQFLAQRPGVVFSRYQIVDAVRGEDYPVTDRAVDVQIVGLRRKLGRRGSAIETVRGVGYRFKADP